MRTNEELEEMGLELFEAKLPEKPTVEDVIAAVRFALRSVLDQRSSDIADLTLQTAESVGLYVNPGPTPEDVEKAIDELGEVGIWYLRLEHESVPGSMVVGPFHGHEQSAKEAAVRDAGNGWRVVETENRQG